MTKMGFIGGGNMATAILHGLQKSGYLLENIWVCDKNSERLRYLLNQFPIHVTENIHEFVHEADIIFLAVKPNAIQSVACELALLIQTKKPLIVSIAAGISIDYLMECLGQNIPIVRTMPNTPALVQNAVTALYAADNVSSSQKRYTEQLLKSIGTVFWLEHESDMNQITAVSGSGPAYLFYVLELLQKNNLCIDFQHDDTLPITLGSLTSFQSHFVNQTPLSIFLIILNAMYEASIQIGLSPTLSMQLIKQTAIGTILLARESKDSLTILRQKVTSKGGTTEAALTVLLASPLEQIIQTNLVVEQEETIKTIFYQAILAAYDRSIQIMNLLRKK